MIRFFILVAVVFLSVSKSVGQQGGASISELVEARIGESTVVAGDEKDWFFLANELRHLAKGAFWEMSWEEISEGETNPVPFISAFNQALQARGIRLVVVPVPPKAAIYPEKLVKGLSVSEVPDPGPFYEMLLEEGVNVIDLRPVFLGLRENPETPLLYCRSDAHFSPYAIEVIADLILENQGMEVGFPEAITQAQPEPLSFVGDLVAGMPWESETGAEILPIRYVFEEGICGVEPMAESRILVLGDSHAQVFHSGKESGRHCRGGGIVDQLSYRLGTPVDLVAVPASGLVQARKQLYFHAKRRPGYWEGKQMVVWIFSQREFTESRDRAVDIPLE